MSEKTIKLFNGEFCVSESEMPNLYKIITNMGVYEAECYIYDFASKMTSLEKPNNEKIKEVIQLIENNKIKNDGTSVLPSI